MQTFQGPQPLERSYSSFPTFRLVTASNSGACEHMFISTHATAFLLRFGSQLIPLICISPESDLLVALVKPVMLQFASTIELPIRFGHPPDSRRMICPSFLKCSGFQPALVANSGSQLTSPCLKTIVGFTDDLVTALVPFANPDSWSMNFPLGGIGSFRSSS